MMGNRLRGAILSVVALLLFSVVLFGAWVCAHPAFGAKPAGARLERMRRSVNYSGGRVRNRQPVPWREEDAKVKREALMKFFFSARTRRTPLVPLPVVRTDLGSLPAQRDAYVWFGHSSFLVQLAGRRFLFDPVFTYQFPSALVLKPFPMEYRYGVNDMPALDYVVITHDHFDHLDYGTIRLLDNHSLNFICALGIGAHLERWGVAPARILELDWDESVALGAGDIRITCCTARHFSGRFLNDRDATLFGSFVLQTASRKLFFSGDGGYGDHFKQIRETHGDFDYAFLECGQYNLAWQYVHCLPDQVAQAAVDLGARHFIPIHNSKFSLALHSWHEPLDSVLACASRRRLSLLTPRIGEVVWLDGRDTAFAPWWQEVTARERALEEKSAEK